MVIVVSQTKTKWGTYTPAEGYKEYDPEEIHAFFIDNLYNDATIFVRNLDNYFLDIIRVYHACGLVDMTREESKKCKEGCYRYLVSDDGKCFSIDVGESLSIRNFEQLVPIKKDQDLCKMHNLPENLKNVCLAMFLSIGMVQGMIGESEKIPLTISSLSLKAWQRDWNKYDFYAVFKDAAKYKVFEDMTLEDYCRPAYHGGWCFLNWDVPHEYKDVQGVTLDVNSLYPYVMEHCPMPYGKPGTWTGEIPANVEKLTKKGQLYFFVKLKASFTLIPGHFPCIQASNNFLHGNEWIESTEIMGMDDEIELTLTCTDYYLLLEHYDIKSLKVLDGVFFKACAGCLYKTFVERFYTIKEHAKNPGERKIAKMIMNGLGGTMAKRRKRRSLILDVSRETLSETIIDMKETEIKAMSYVYLGAAITSYGRKIIVGLAHENKEHFIYSDTDSLHLNCPISEVKGIKISEKLGDFKVEAEWTEAIFFTKKIYAERRPGEASFKCAGLDSEFSEMIARMLANKPVGCPDGIPKSEYSKVRGQLYLSMDFLKKIYIPYTEKTYSNFTYTKKAAKMRLKMAKKQEKCYKLI